jgi:hypothetical protein
MRASLGLAVSIAGDGRLGKLCKTPVSMPFERDAIMFLRFCFVERIASTVVYCSCTREDGFDSKSIAGDV